MLPISAFAETGTITISGTSLYHYQPTAGVAASGNLQYENFTFRNSSYSTIAGYQIQFTTGQVQFYNNSGFSDFTIISGGTGSGTFYYNKSGMYLAWVFNSGTVINSSSFRLSYSDTSVFSQWETIVLSAVFAGSPSDTEPISILSTTGGGFRSCVCHTAGTVPFQDANVGSYTTNSYTVEYRTVGSTIYYNATITKTNLPTKVQTRDYYGAQQTDALFNSTPSMFFYPYGIGLYLNISLSNGINITTLINSTGTPATPTPAPTPTANPSTGAGIVWNKNNYTINEIGTITWLVESGILDSLYDFNIRISDSSGEVQRFDNIDVSGLTGNVQYQFPVIGTYTASFHKDLCTFLGCISEIELDSKSVSVTLSPSYLFINSTIPSQITFNASYIFGTTPAIQGELNSVIIEFLGINGYESVSTTTLGNNNIVGGTSYNVSLIVPKPGTFRFTLFDISKGKLVSVIANAVNVFIPPQQHVTTSFITTDKSSYYFGESILVSYAYDDSNYSNYQKFFSLNNTDNGIYTFPGTVLYDQVAMFELPISSGSIPGYCSGTTSTCYITSTTNFYAGNNRIDLMVKNSAVNFSIANTTFTISNTNLEGYGFPAANTPVCTGTTIVVRSSGNGTINVMLRQAGATYQQSILYQTWNTTGNNQTRYLKLAYDGDYAFYLLDTSGNTQFNYYVHASSASCAGATPIPSPRIGGGLTPNLQAAEGLLSVFSNIAFYGFVIWLGIISGTIAMMVRYGGQVSGTGIVFVGWIAAIFISLIGLFGDFKIYIIVITTIIAAIMFYAGRRTTVEGQ